jgi:diacylglycerol kinase
MLKCLQFIRSLKYAFNGLFYIWHEQNFRIQFFISLLVIFLMFYFGLGRLEKVAIFFAIFSVLILESLNTIFERLSDILKPRLHEYVHIIKDIMAAVVLLASFGAVIIGLLIFWPYVFAGV